MKSQQPSPSAEPVLICAQLVENSIKAPTSQRYDHHATNRPAIQGFFMQSSRLSINKYICPTASHSHPVAIVDNLNTGNISVECPTLPICSSLEMPQNQNSGTEITEPVVNNNQKPVIEAKNIMKIRRRKMNRHQLKKFRKRMKFVLLKQRMAKEKKKEAAFQAMLADIRQDAENYDALQFIKGELEAARRGGFWIDIRQTAKKPSP